MKRCANSAVKDDGRRCDESALATWIANRRPVKMREPLPVTGPSALSSPVRGLSAHCLRVWEACGEALHPCAQGRASSAADDYRRGTARGHYCHLRAPSARPPTPLRVPRPLL